jgi:hypothetical protein
MSAAEEISRLQLRIEKLRFALEQIGCTHEFLDADGAKMMLRIARNAVNEDEANSGEAA